MILFQHNHVLQEGEFQKPPHSFFFHVLVGLWNWPVMLHKPVMISKEKDWLMHWIFIRKF